jgi:hypothetical protein
MLSHVLPSHYSAFYIARFVMHVPLNSMYLFNELFSDNSFTMFCRTISLHLSFAGLLVRFKLRSRCFLHANVNPVLNSSSFDSVVPLNVFSPLRCAEARVESFTNTYIWHTVNLLPFQLAASFNNLLKGDSNFILLLIVRLVRSLGVYFQKLTFNLFEFFVTTDCTECAGRSRVLRAVTPCRLGYNCRRFGGS